MSNKEVIEKVVSFFIDHGFTRGNGIKYSDTELFIKLEDGDTLYYRINKVNRPTFHNGWPIAYHESPTIIDMTYWGEAHAGADYDYMICETSIKMDNDLSEITKHLLSRPSMIGIMRNYRLKELGI